MKSDMRLPNNNSCFTKCKKHNSQNNPEVKIVKVPTVDDQDDTENPDNESLNPEYTEEIPNQVITLVEKSAPIVSPEEISFVNIPDSSFTSDEESSTKTIFEKSNYVQSKVKGSQFGIRWSILTDVVNSKIKEKMAKPEIFLQEAMFEVISSEAKYFSGLEIVVNHFKKSYLFSPSNDKVGYVNPIDKFHVFSNITSVMKTSSRLLSDLELRWIREKPILKDVCDILYQHACSNSFYNYVIYISNQSHQMKEFERLMESELIKKELLRLESYEISKNLPLSSYLLLPFQRLTRLKLLTENILKGLHEMDQKIYASQIKSAKLSIRKFEDLLMISQKNRVERNLDELQLNLKEKSDFQNNCKIIDISDKRLLKVGEFELVPLKKESKSKKKNPTFILLLFADMMMIAKRNGSRVQVLDYCLSKDVVLTNLIKVKAKSKKKIENPNEENMKISIQFKRNASGFLNDPITLISDRCGVFDQWKVCLPEPRNSDNRDNLSIYSDRQWQSVKNSIVKIRA